jgi:hypothetical protein
MTFLGASMRRVGPTTSGMKTGLRRKRRLPRQDILAYQRRFAAHVAVHVLDSETEAYGLTDSPVGMFQFGLSQCS